MVLISVVGIAGLGASLCAIESGHDLALANKESLVTGGHLVTESVSSYDSSMLISVAVYLIPMLFLLRRKKLPEVQLYWNAYAKK